MKLEVKLPKRSRWIREVKQGKNPVYIVVPGVLYFP